MSDIEDLPLDYPIASPQADQAQSLMNDPGAEILATACRNMPNRLAPSLSGFCP